jgi:hypothetical protein
MTNWLKKRNWHKTFAAWLSGASVLFALIIALDVCAPNLRAQNNQNQPDCIIGPVTVSTTGRSTPYDNRVVNGNGGCANWTLMYFANSATSLSIELDQAPDNNGVAGTWVIWPTADLGLQSVMPLTALTADNASAFEFSPWVSVNLTTFTGGGNITYFAFGYRPKFGADAGGIAGVSAPPNIPGTTDPCQSELALKQSVAINISAAGSSALVAASGTKAIYVCAFAFTQEQSATSADTLAFGFSTVGACASGITSLTGTFGSGVVVTTSGSGANIVNINGAGTLFTAPAGNGLCATAAGTAVNNQGFVTYVQQ